MRNSSKKMTLALIGVVSVLILLTGRTAAAQTVSPGNLLLSRSEYQGTAATVAVGQALSGADATTFTGGETLLGGTVASTSGFTVGGTAEITTGGMTYPVTIATVSKSKLTLTWTLGVPALPTAPLNGDRITQVSFAVADGSYPGVWANEGPDASFGVTSPIFLDQMPADGSGTVLSTFAVDATQMVTSFSSKSELGLNLSPDGSLLTFMGYNAGVNLLDVSNANTPGHPDPTNPVSETYQRMVGQFDSTGTFMFTPVNAYSGNNGRAAIAANGLYYLAGNAGNGSGTEPLNIIDNTGVQATTPGGSADTTVIGQQQGVCSPVATSGCQFGFATGEAGDPDDKSGKDDNFRGVTIFDNTLYVTKGSGSNGVDTVYQVGNPETLPTLATASSTPITILTGFPTVAAKTEANNSTNYPFGVWFANPTTLYVADEGQDSAPFDPADNPNAGLEKWTFDGSQWNLAYVLQNGLNIGTQYSVPNDAGGDVYPTSLDPAPADLRALTGRLNGDGTATIWAVTSTTSTNTDQGADPNQLVMITDDVSAPGPSAPAGEAFSVVRTAQYGEVFRGVSFTPGTINPVETVSVAPPPNGSGWNNTDVTVIVTATLADPAVPVQSIVYSFTGAQSGTQTVPGSPAVATVSAEGDTTVSYYAQDAAGSRNATSTLPTPLMIDKTPPVIAFAGDAGSYTVDQTIAITCTASDALSGLASDSCPGASGPAYSFALGLHTLNASATDQAGNVANASASFTVSVTYGSLAKLTQQFVTNKPLIDGTLTLELDLASQAASKGLREIKDLAIQAYIDEVSAESGKFLTAAQAAILIQLAETLL